MNDSKYKIRTLAYYGICLFLFLLAILLLILGLVTKNLGGTTFIIISIVLFVLGLLYSVGLHFIINSLKNRYKEFVIDDAFLTYHFYYSSRQMGISNKNKYAILEKEFLDLNYYKATDEFSYFANELVVGSIRDIQFRSNDYAYLTSLKNVKKCGRIYSLNLKSDNEFKLVITKDNNYTSLKKLDINLLDYNVFTNNIDLANKYIKIDSFNEKIKKIEHYGALFFEIYNGSLYFIIDGIKNSFDINNREYNDIANDVEREIFIINNVIDSFKFEYKVQREKPLKIK